MTGQEVFAARIARIEAKATDRPTAENSRVLVPGEEATKKKRGKPRVNGGGLKRMLMITALILIVPPAFSVAVIAALQVGGPAEISALVSSLTAGG